METQQRPRIVVVGAGFAGFHAARRRRRLMRGTADLTVVNPTDAAHEAEERRARCTFVVVGAGFTGVEVAAQGQLLADRVLPELDERLAKTATQKLTVRGVEIHTETTLEEATADGVKLSSGQFVPTHTLVWCKDSSAIEASCSIPSTREE